MSYEYRVLDIPPIKKALATKINRTSSTKIEVKAAINPSADVTIINILRSIRSDNQPIGNWNTIAPRQNAATKVEISDNDNPAVVPNTGAIPN